MKRERMKRMAAAALSMVTALSLLPAMPVSAEGRHLVWERENGRDYWYENDVRRGIAGDPQNVWYDDTERGSEIYDPASDAWYWLDTLYDGAKAVGKEVFMPYVYGGEKDMNSDRKKALAYESNDAEENIEHAKMGFQIWQSMISENGKWVRYDEKGAMLKGWVTITGALADIYKDQAGNTYYYDRRTGAMAKGVVEINGAHHSFDRTSGKYLGVTTESTDEEKYFGAQENPTPTPDPAPATDPEPVAASVLALVSREEVYTTTGTGNRDLDQKSEYSYETTGDSNIILTVKTYTKYNGVYMLTGEEKYDQFYFAGADTPYLDSRMLSSKVWRYDSEAGNAYLYSEIAYTYAGNSVNESGRVKTYYKEDGSKDSVQTLEFEYDAGGNLSKETSTTESFSGKTNSTYSKSETLYTRTAQGQILTKLYRVLVYPGLEGAHDDEKYEYTYDSNGNMVEERYYGARITQDPATAKKTYELVLKRVGRNTYQKVDGEWCEKSKETIRVTNGVATSEVIYRNQYTYENGKRVIESYNLENGTSILESRSVREITKDSKGYTVQYRFHLYPYDSETGTYGIPRLVHGYQHEFVYTADASAPGGYREEIAREIDYKDENEDGEEEIEMYTEYETGFDFSAAGMTVGETRSRKQISYNADGSVYCTLTETYEAR